MAAQTIHSFCDHSSFPQRIVLTLILRLFSLSLYFLVSHGLLAVVWKTQQLQRMKHSTVKIDTEDFRNLISESVIITSPRKSPQDSQTLSPPFTKKSPKKDFTFLPQQQYVRIPISLSLLHSIANLKNESNRELYLYFNVFLFTTLNFFHFISSQTLLDMIAD